MRGFPERNDPMASPHSSPSGVTDLPSPVLGAPLLREQDRRPGEGTYVGRVVLAEDDGEMRAFLALLLRSQGLDVIECPDGEARSEERRVGKGWRARASAVDCNDTKEEDASA